MSFKKLIIYFQKFSGSEYIFEVLFCEYLVGTMPFIMQFVSPPLSSYTILLITKCLLKTILTGILWLYGLIEVIIVTPGAAHMDVSLPVLGTRF